MAQADGAGLKLTPSEIEAAGLTLEEAEALDGYISDTEPSIGEDAGPQLDFMNVLVVDGLPIAPLSKFDKLSTFVGRIFAGVAAMKPSGLYLVKDEAAGKTTGFAFVEYKDMQEAEKALKATDGMKFDAKHTLVVNRYEDLNRFDQLSEELEDPIKAPWQPRPDLWSWIKDPAHRDQFLLRFSEGAGANVRHGTEVSFASVEGEVEFVHNGGRMVEEGRSWTEQQATWSPQGTYVITQHPQGVLLWGGPDFQECRRFAHPAVESVYMSPCERWIATWNGIKDNAAPDRAYIVWDVRTGAELRAFRQVNLATGECDAKWSPNGNFVARLDVDYTTDRDLIRVYVPPGMGLLEKRSIPAPGAQQLAWCPHPKVNYLTWVVPEEGDKPATITLMDIPSRDVLRTKQLFNVENMTTQWHPQGKFFCVQATMLTKAQAKYRKRYLASDNTEKLDDLLKKVQEAPHGTSFEFFRVQERSIPTTTLQVAGKVVSLDFEPHGTRFAIVHGRGPAHYDVSFYSLPSSTAAATDGAAAETGQQAEWLFTLPRKTCCKVFWSPNGKTCVLAGLGDMGGELEFYDVEHQESYATATHMQCSDIKWDPSGRVVASIKAQPMTDHGSMKLTVNNGYRLWSCQGESLTHENFPCLYDLCWRPRPTLLSAKVKKQVIADMPSRLAQFEAEEKEERERRELLKLCRRRRARDKYRAHMASRKAWMAEVQELRIKRGLVTKEDEVTKHTETYTQIVKQTVERYEG
ncbi:eif3b [Symbiodinium sp. KB8]|nr:eif3b [Symbiodinium sp. KB8]